MNGRCEICGEMMPRGEEMFKFHGYSGPCPKPPLSHSKKSAIQIASVIVNSSFPEAQDQNIRCMAEAVVKLTEENAKKSEHIKLLMDETVDLRHANKVKGHQLDMGSKDLQKIRDQSQALKEAEELIRTRLGGINVGQDWLVKYGEKK